MNSKDTDVMIRTQVSLSEDQFSEVARQVKNIEGVSRFDRHQKIPRLIMVAYNTGHTRAITILNKFTRLGFQASLVGI